MLMLAVAPPHALILMRHHRRVCYMPHSKGVHYAFAFFNINITRHVLNNLRNMINHLRPNDARLCVPLLPGAGTGRGGRTLSCVPFGLRMGRAVCGLPNGVRAASPPKRNGYIHTTWKAHTRTSVDRLAFTYPSGSVRIRIRRCTMHAPDAERKHAHTRDEGKARRSDGRMCFHNPLNPTRVCNVM